MKIYDDSIKGFNEILSSLSCSTVAPKSWNDAGKNQIIFQNDMAYELGGGNLPAISSIMLTSDDALVNKDEIIVYGNDLSQISSNTPFARLTFVKVNDELMGQGEELYQNVMKLDYIRYRLNPEGYMMRISTFDHRECVRVSKNALKNGLSFSNVGDLFIKAYHKYPFVEAVKIVFITLPNLDYKELAKKATRVEEITQALDHVLKNIKMDCDSCGLKAICDEVEELCSKIEPTPKK